MFVHKSKICSKYLIKLETQIASSVFLSTYSGQGGLRSPAEILPKAMHVSCHLNVDGKVFDLLKLLLCVNVPYAALLLTFCGDHRSFHLGHDWRIPAWLSGVRVLNTSEMMPERVELPRVVILQPLF